MNSTERMILGNDCIYSGDPEETGLNRNVLIVGNLMWNQSLWRH